MCNFYAWVQTTYSKNIKAWHFDGGGEFNSKGLEGFFKEKGISIQKSLLYTQQQNGNAAPHHETP